MRAPGTGLRPDPVIAFGRKQIFDFLSSLTPFPDRLTAGQQFLVLFIGVRIPVREPTKRPQFSAVFLFVLEWTPMNPDLLRWLIAWVVLVIAFYFGLGYYLVLDLIPHILIATNVVTFMLVLFDKIAASMQLRRIPEKALFVATFFGGSIGMLVGIFTIRHKSRKVSFQFIVGILVLLQVVMLLWYFNPDAFTQGLGMIE